MSTPNPCRYSRKIWRYTIQITHFSDLYLQIRAKKQDQNGLVKSADSLMDILLHNWTYFEHSHSTLGKVRHAIHWHRVALVLSLDCSLTPIWYVDLWADR